MKLATFVLYFNLFVIAMNGAILMQPNPVYPVLSWIALGMGVLGLAFWLATNKAQACAQIWRSFCRLVAQMLRVVADAFDS